MLSKKKRQIKVFIRVIRLPKPTLDEIFEPNHNFKDPCCKEKAQKLKLILFT